MSISDILSQYASIRQINQTELERRKQLVYTTVPEIKEIDEKKEELQLKMLGAALDGITAGIDPISMLRKRKAMLLKEAGFSNDFLDPVYTCKACHDTGTLDDTTKCECFKKRILEDKLDAARLTDTNISFELFDLNVFDDAPMKNGKSQRDFMRSYKTATKKYADTFPDCQTILLLSGSTGLGKTYIAKCIMRRVIERGYTAAFYTAYRLFSMFHSHRLGEKIDLEPVFSVPLLIIDDLGTEPMTQNVTVEYFFDLINERTSSRLHTIIVTNLALHELQNRYDDRIHSRLIDKNSSFIILFDGSDIRRY